MIDGFEREVMSMSWGAEFGSQLFWIVEGNSARFYLNSSDVFCWGSAEAEEILPENVGELRRCCELCNSDREKYGWCEVELWAARVRKQRPQNAMYRQATPAMRLLFDECGPERAVGLGNPHQHWTTWEEKK